MCRVLIVDDEENCVNMLRLSLIEDGFEVETALQGEEAISKAETFLPDILISDWRLKHAIDGTQVARTLQGLRPELKVVLFSGSPSEDLLEHSTGVNLFAVLEKPLGLDEVTQVIRKACSLNQMMTAGELQRAQQ